MAPRRKTQHSDPITLAEFVERVPVTLRLFVAATMQAYEEGDKSMNPDQARPEAWWFRDIAAYLNVIDLEDGGK